MVTAEQTLRELIKDTLTSEDLAYIAGFFDGEGCIMIAKWNENRNTKMLVTVTNTKDGIPNWLQSIFGGYIHKLKSKTIKHKDRYTWMVGSHRAAKFLYTLQPYLKLKSEQAELAIEFQRTQHQGSRRGGSEWLPPFTSEEVEYRDFLYNSLKELNRRGNGSKPI